MEPNALIYYHTVNIQNKNYKSLKKNRNGRLLHTNSKLNQMYGVRSLNAVLWVSEYVVQILLKIEHIILFRFA